MNDDDATRFLYRFKNGLDVVRDQGSEVDDFDRDVQFSSASSAALKETGTMAP